MTLTPHISQRRPTTPGASTGSSSSAPLTPERPRLRCGAAGCVGEGSRPSPSESPPEAPSEPSSASSDSSFAILSSSSQIVRRRMLAEGAAAGLAAGLAAVCTGAGGEARRGRVARLRRRPGRIVE